MIAKYWLITLILSAAMIISVAARKLNLPGALLGGLIGILLFAGSGYTGIAMIAAFFLLGTAATSWKTTFKQRAGLAEANKGRRTAAQVIANGGAAAVMATMAGAFPEEAGLFQLMMASCFAAATADTL